MRVLGFMGLVTGALLMVAAVSVFVWVALATALFTESEWAVYRAPALALGGIAAADVPAAVALWRVSHPVALPSRRDPGEDAVLALAALGLAVAAVVCVIVAVAVAPAML